MPASQRFPFGSLTHCPHCRLWALYLNVLFPLWFCKMNVEKEGVGTSGGSRVLLNVVWKQSIHLGFWTLELLQNNDQPLHKSCPRADCLLCVLPGHSRGTCGQVTSDTSWHTFGPVQSLQTRRGISRMSSHTKMVPQIEGQMSMIFLCSYVSHSNTFFPLI